MHADLTRWLRTLAVCAVAVALVACSDKSAGGDDDDDEDDDEPRPAPAAITDLRVVDSSLMSITLRWTVPDSNATHDKVRMYDLRMHYEPITTANWSQCGPWFSVPLPGQCGDTQSVIVKPIGPGVRYYFAINCNNFYDDWSGLSNVATAQTLPDVLMSIPDTALESVIREKIGKPLGQFMASEIAMIDVLDSEARGIAELTGIEYCENLTILHVSDNEISDLSPLAKLKNLRILGARNNQVSDLTPMAQSPLFQLIVPDNNISDVTPIATMPDIRVMALHNNQIVDIASLVASPYIGPDDQLILTNNPLSVQSVTEYIPALQARLVLVIH